MVNTNKHLYCILLRTFSLLQLLW